MTSNNLKSRKLYKITGKNRIFTKAAKLFKGREYITQHLTRTNNRQLTWISSMILLIFWVISVEWKSKLWSPPEWWAWNKAEESKVKESTIFKTLNSKDHSKKPWPIFLLLLKTSKPSKEPTWRPKDLRLSSNKKNNSLLIMLKRCRISTLISWS